MTKCTIKNCDNELWYSDRYCHIHRCKEFNCQNKVVEENENLCYWHLPRHFKDERGE